MRSSFTVFNLDRLNLYFESLYKERSTLKGDKSQCIHFKRQIMNKIIPWWGEVLSRIADFINKKNVILLEDIHRKNKEHEHVAWICHVA